MRAGEVGERDLDVVAVVLGLRAAGFDAAEVPGRNASGQCELKLAHPPSDAPIAEQRAEVGLGTSRM